MTDTKYFFKNNMIITHHYSYGGDGCKTVEKISFPLSRVKYMRFFCDVLNEETKLFFNVGMPHNEVLYAGKQDTEKVKVINDIWKAYSGEE